jgi:23S rRNA (uracil1939-C5)-methyltransferase
MTRPRPPVKVGQEVELVVNDLAFGGAGVARVEGFTVFVRGGLPGQTVRARIVKRKDGFAEARIEAVLVKSPDEIAPVCRHFGPCGGCLWQNLDYERQLAAKAGQVRDCLVRLGGIPDPPLTAPLAAPAGYGYRNKMEFSFADRAWDEPDSRFGVGLHVRGRFDKVLNNAECVIAPPWMAAVLGTVRELAVASGLPPSLMRTHEGFFRFLVLRDGRNTGERMAHLITWPCAPGSAEERAVDAILAGVRARHPEMTCLLHGMTGSKASVAYCETWRTVIGKPTITERLLGFDFDIGPNTFFQTNSAQAERLFTRALELAGGPVDLAWDLYCGVGALTLPLSRRAGRVVGAELIEASIAAARANAAANGVTNAEFVAIDMKDALTEAGLVDRAGRLVSGRPDLVLVDPPRDGLHADVTAGLNRLAPPVLVYVSCNPSTLARDAARLAEGGYVLDTATPVDMFPQTAHVEMVARFRRGDV